MMSRGDRADAAAAEALRDVRSRFLHPGATGGVIVRLWECSMPCLGLEKDAPTPRCVGCSDIRRCLAVELARDERAASLLRWDLPLAIFLNGVCTAYVHASCQTLTANERLLHCAHAGAPQQRGARRRHHRRAPTSTPRATM